MASEIRDYEVSLSTLAGRKIVDLAGYRCDEFGDPTFKLTRVLFEDGTAFDIEGEHDFPYIDSNNPDFTARLEELEE
jgi:hypothetical protein